MDSNMRIDTPKSTPGLPASISPPRTRRTLPQEAHGITATRTSDDEGLSLEVDHMILDYLLYDAVQACLYRPASIDSATHRVDEFLALFNTRHAEFTPDPELQFRQLLLQLLTLVTNRRHRTPATPPVESLLALRAENASRARSWIHASGSPSASYDLSHSDEALPLKEVTLDSYRRSSLASDDTTSESRFYGSEQSISLLDLLPLFMKVSALACTGLYTGGINDLWMRLAIEWMLQACLEQFLIFGTTDTEFIYEAFAWGYQREGKGAVNDMFEDAEYKMEVKGWKEWKERRLGELMAEVQGESVERKLKRLAKHDPVKDFEKSYMGFLEALAQCIPEPVLVQLEKGKLEGMSEVDTMKFLRNCGIGEGGLAAAL